MTGDDRAPFVSIRFGGLNSAAFSLDIHPDTSIGQLQLAAAELAELAREARTGERMRQAQQRLETAAIAAQLRNGGRA